MVKKSKVRRNLSVTALKGLVRKPVSPVTIAMMDEVIVTHARKRYKPTELVAESYERTIEDMGMLAHHD